ncbi:MAG: RNA polymerase sigma-70 factor [Bacteroidota bacterium]
MENKDSTCHPRSFRSLYDQYSDALRNFVYYRSGDNGFAEDVAQESFLRLWKNCVNVPYEKAKSFLYTVAHNLILDRAKHHQVELKFRALPKQTTDTQHPEFLLEEQEFKAKLEQAINALPENQRVVFLMNRIDKMKYREIAQTLGLSQKAVEKRMHKALLFLRTTIGNI